MFPSKMTISVGPFKLIPAQTWTFTGCLALKVNFYYIHGILPSYKTGIN